MARWGLLFFLVIGLAVSACGQRFDGRPDVTVLSPVSALVRFSTSVPISARVDYGPYAAYAETGTFESSWSYGVAVSEGALTVEVELSGLTPGLRYAAQVVLVDGMVEELGPVLDFTLVASPEASPAPLAKAVPEPPSPPEAPVASGAEPAPKLVGAPSEGWPSWISGLASAPLPAPSGAIIEASLLFLALFAFGLWIANNL